MSSNINDNIRFFSLLYDEFRRYATDTSETGIFRSDTRLKLVKEYKTIAQEGSADYWLDRRGSVIRGLKDLELFLWVADEKNINMSIKNDNFLPFLEALFELPIIDLVEPNTEKAKIACSMVVSGFKYLQSLKRQHLTDSHRRTLQDAYDLAEYLSDRFVVDEILEKRVNTDD